MDTNIVQRSARLPKNHLRESDVLTAQRYGSERFILASEELQQCYKIVVQVAGWMEFLPSFWQAVSNQTMVEWAEPFRTRPSQTNQTRPHLTSQEKPDQTRQPRQERSMADEPEQSCN